MTTEPCPVCDNPEAQFRPLMNGTACKACAFVWYDYGATKGSRILEIRRDPESAIPDEYRLLPEENL